MREETDAPTQWPPPPDFVSRRGEDEANHLAQAKLSTGAAWADALLGSLMSLISFTLLTFILANPLAWHIVPRAWSSEFRLLCGWSLASIVQVAGGTISWRQHYEALSRSILWTGILAALFWLLTILVVCWLFG